jgi:type VI secretion system protein ImpK
LSPHWRGADLGYRPLTQRLPLWAIGAGTVLIAALVYLAFNFTLAGSSDVAFAEMTGLPPHGTPSIPRVAPPPPPPPPPAVSTLSTKLHQFLAPEIKSGLVVVLEDAQSLTVRLTNRNMFGSGEATMTAGYDGLLARIGAALDDEKGMVTVNGYTDNQPIHTARFPSNFELSQARADAVARVIAAKMSDPKRVKAIGRADADPLAPNNTADGRQQNRRTEIVLTRTSETP